ncbi:class I SAM-dependent methyltransferase [Georgenia subflava]|uniref:Methyltransferase domain-containing protein n=1 Tax=Georgenia subflava TaxID=1622177 RepID=A0A6N7EQ16_9MICO|nr:class I SAM-dependent methyltransferase [Georgenia subflava]MPV38987.1 methyltransferase domain-containing protein [Georgenia subflava]
MPKMSGIETALCRSALWGRFARDVVLPWALQGQDVNGDVLEVGAGNGEMTAALLRRSPGVRVTLTDIDERMVAAARDRLRRTSVSVEPADARALHFHDASFDFVLSFLMLHHVVNWQSALAEASRVLKPGGMLIGYDLTASPPAKLIHLVDGSRHQLLQPAELTTTVRDMGLDVSLRTGWAGQVMRFLALKS